MRSARACARIAFQYMLPGLAAKRIIRRQPFTEPELALLPSFVDSSRCAIDVGANIGHYSRALAPLVPEVFAFEAHPRMARMLRASAPHNVKVQSLAISDTRGLAQLSVPWIEGHHAEGLSSIDRENPVSTSRDHDLITVEAVPLDDIALPGIGFIKIDVEGHELHVLRGAQRLIEREKPILLIEAEERHRTGAVDSVSRFLFDKGYGGIFVHNGQIHDIKLFEAALQDASILCSNNLTNYIYNFIFMPIDSFERIVSAVSAALQDRTRQRLNDA